VWWGKTFGELQRLLPGISPKTLSQRLKELEKHGVVTKKVFHEMPLRVEYSLTEKGASLKKVIAQMDEWGKSSV
jgi:DNA-binding HxlR family transcriptional regulator